MTSQDKETIVIGTATAIILILFGWCASSCLPQINTPVTPPCQEAPATFMEAGKTNCLGSEQDTCCGYGFRRASDGVVCFHIVCQTEKCGQWKYYETECDDG